MYLEYLGSVWGWQMARAGDATQEGAHSQSQGGSPGEGRYQGRQDCQHVHLSVYLSTHIKCRLMTARFQSFVHYQYPSSKNWLIRAEEKLDISATNFLHLSSLRCCQKLHWPQYSIPTATEDLEPQHSSRAHLIYSLIDRNWPRLTGLSQWKLLSWLLLVLCKRLIGEVVNHGEGP